MWLKTLLVVSQMPDHADITIQNWKNVLAKPGARVHMVGIGGVGMAGLALLIKSQGHHVTGCDAYEGALLPWLASEGIACSVGHHASHITAQQPHLVVRSPAVALAEDELQTATRLGVPVVDRGEVLPYLLNSYRLAAVAGTHGKTTTASMLAWIMKRSGLTISYVIGGVCPNLGAVADVHSDGIMVVEADESDGTLQHYTPDIGIITSMDLDHVDYFRDVDGQNEVFRRFVTQARRIIVPSSDEAAMTIVRDHPAARSFGLTPEADVSASDVQLNSHDACFRLRSREHGEHAMQLGVPGLHNVLNALAAATAALAWGVSMPAIAQALREFRLPRRRFEVIFEDNRYRVISDYAHHPVEITALLKQAHLLKPQRMIAVFQPHRYSRTAAFKKEFARSLAMLDYLVLTPVYAASEHPVDGGSSSDLYDECQALGLRKVELADSLSAAWEKLHGEMMPGDLILIIGAGDVERIGAWAAEQLAAG
jgi:UDP-N-acetylmuramate--alanine ligase